MLCLLAFRLFQAYFRWFYSCNWYAILVAVFYAICHGRGVIFWHSQTLWIFQSVSTRHYEFFRVFGFTKIPLFIFRPLLLSFFSVKKKKTNWRSCTELLNFQVFFLSRPQLWFISFSTFRQIKRHNRVCRTLSCTGWSGHTLESDKSKSIEWNLTNKHVYYKMGL